MHKNSYLNLDIQALHNFLIIMETGSITATAKQLNVTQSAVSHGVDKLRDIFQDPLFIRAGRGIMPTPRAQQLFQALKPMLANIEALTLPTDFSPANAKIEWTIAANDFQRDALIPNFYQQVLTQVNDFSLSILPSEAPAVELLREGAVDLVISPMPPDAPDILQTRLFRSGISCFFDETCRSAPMTLEDFQQAYYISLTFMAGNQMFNKENPIALDIERNIRVRVANFSGLASFLKHSELLTIVPSLLKKGSLAKFKEAPLPFHTQPLNIYMLWHQRYQGDATHKWLRSQLLEVTKALNL